MGFHLEKDEPVGAGFQRILMLSPFRDADARLETFDKLVDRATEAERFVPLRDLLGASNRDDKTILKHIHNGTSKEDVQALLALAEQRELELQAEAETIGRHIYAEKPGAFIRRMFVYWETWEAEVPALEGAENETLIPH